MRNHEVSGCTRVNNLQSDVSHNGKMPVLFIGHGNPMNGIEDNSFSHGWQKLGEALPRPKAVLCVSAHWLTEDTYVNTSPRPDTIHDFWGFPRELYEVLYKCPGTPGFAQQAQSLVTAASVTLTEDWGIDHGTWVPMRRLFPEADIPTFQLSIDMTQPDSFHYQVGRELAPLREQGVLIVASGNIVHNLGAARFDEGAPPYDWAGEFDRLSEKLISAGEDAALIDYRSMGKAAALSIPTPDHYWPLLYVLGARSAGDEVSYPVGGIAHGSVSMRTVLFGATA